MNNRTMIVPDLDTGKEKALPVVKVFHWNCQSLTPRLKIHSVWYLGIVDFSSIQFSRSVMSNSLWPCGLQHARPPCPSPVLGVYPNLRPLSRWCRPTISSSVVPFSSCPQSFPASGSFQEESALRIRWPKYWSFSFNISSSNEHSGLTSFRMDLGMNIQRQSRS